MTLEELNLRTDQIRSLYLIHLQQMYSAEEQMFSAAPTLAVSIFMPEIKVLLLTEAGQAPERLTLLTDILTALGGTPTGPICLPVKALVDLGMEVNVQNPAGPQRDMLLLSVALEMKHLNIAKYLMAATYARALNLPEQAHALTQVQRNESNIDHQLRFLLESTHLTDTVMTG
jgi:ferritin-like metal-binding protein YciE